MCFPPLSGLCALRRGGPGVLRLGPLLGEPQVDSEQNGGLRIGGIAFVPLREPGGGLFAP